MSRGKIVVVGGSGFLGSHVADSFSRAGHDVTIVDVQPSPWRSSDQKEIIADVRDLEALKSAFAGAGTILNFSGIADIAAAGRDPIRTMEINILGTVNTIEAALQCGVKRYLFASTVYVYSDQGGFYRASKQACEAIIRTYGEERGLAYTVLRYGTLYGRRAGPTNRIRAMVVEALRSKRISYPGSGQAMRDFIHVNDAAALTVRALDPAYAGHEILITGQERTKVADIARMISEILMNKVEMNFADGEPEGHYLLTPYSFSPSLSYKLVPNHYVDIGQGLLDCIQEAWGQEHPGEEIAPPG
ncbi:NAD(P)-dependent oxidoreductase [soil metagenome]